MHNETFTAATGQSLFAFPANGNAASWSSLRVPCAQFGPGRYTVTVDETVDRDWFVYVSDSVPADFRRWIYAFEIERTPTAPPAGIPVVPGSMVEAASQPISVSADGTSVSMPSVMDRIEAQAFDAANAQGAKPKRGIRFSKLIPGSAVGETRRNY